MHSEFLSYRSSTIHYLRLGTGSRLVFCLHGYGETAESFSFLATGVPEDQSLIAIDLPFHGQTDWKEGRTMEVYALHEILQHLHHQYGKPGCPFILLGFSLGGRLALKLVQESPERISKMVLLAPDGLKVNRWYWLATQTQLGNRLFAFTMKYPQWFFQFMQLGERLGVVNSSIQKFARQHIHNETVRNDLYERWTCMRMFVPHLPEVQKQVLQHRIPVRLLYGAHDRMILPGRGKKFKKGIESLCTLQVIDSGHQVLHEKNAAYIISLLYS